MGSLDATSEVYKEFVEEIIYPKPLPIINFGETIDEYGFTMWEKITLKNAWARIEPFQRRYGREMFHNFLVAHHYVIDHFRFKRKIDLEHLHGHALTLMKLFGKLIHTLNSRLEFRLTLEEALLKHKQTGIKVNEMKIMIDIFVNYLINCPALCRHVSHTFKKAINRMLYIVEKYFLKYGEESEILESSGSTDTFIILDVKDSKLMASSTTKTNFF